MKEITRHNGRFIIDSTDRVLKDHRSLADKIEDWLDPDIAFRGGHSETSPLIIWRSIQERQLELIMPTEDLARIQDAILRATERLRKK